MVDDDIEALAEELAELEAAWEKAAENTEKMRKNLSGFKGDAKDIEK